MSLSRVRRLLLLVITLFGTSAASAQAARPNVVILLIDDFGYGDIACYGGSLQATPQMDRMAREGVRFTQGYVASPICSPSRCGLLTGQFPARWRITSYLQTRAGNAGCEMVDALDPAAPTLPRLLQSAGYKTAHIGKWHLGGGRDVVDPPKFARYGYDLGLGTYESPEPAAPLGLNSRPWDNDREPGQVARHDRTRWMVDQTVAFLEGCGDRPGFVNLWIDDTHTPFRPSPEQLAAIGAKTPPPGEAGEIIRYRAVLHALDQQVGRLLDALRNRNTLVILVGDNGALPTFGQQRVAGLRGSKLSLYEGGIRVPFIAWWPGRAKSGVVNDQTVLSTVDLSPSIARLCEVALPAEARPDGEDLSPAILGDTPSRSRPLFWEYGRNNESFAYPKELSHRSPNVAIREGDWKLVVYKDGSGAALYNIVKDPRETRDVAEQNPELTARLKSSALEWRHSLPAP